ncbi:hypothetical protein J6590_082261 [Homalodisca vitripennis]|nr:hypothetical protein J6590_082261 [Homalodisca vitripennis]
MTPAPFLYTGADYPALHHPKTGATVVVIRGGAAAVRRPDAREAVRHQRVYRRTPRRPIREILQVASLYCTISDPCLLLRVLISEGQMCGYSIKYKITNKDIESLECRISKFDDNVCDEPQSLHLAAQTVAVHGVQASSLQRPGVRCDCASALYNIG